MFDLNELDKLMQNTADIICKDIASAQGIREEEYVMLVESTLIEPWIIAIDAGAIPTIRIDSKYILRIIMEPDAKKRTKMKMGLRRLLALTFSKIHRMHRTLALVPLAESIALKEGAKKFVRTMFPEKIHYTIPDVHFIISASASVTVTDPITNMAVTLNGDNISLLTKQAKQKLVNLLASNEYFAKVQEEKNSAVEISKYEEKPSTIKLTTNENDEDKVGYEYDS